MGKSVKLQLFFFGCISFCLAFFCQQWMLEGVPHVSDETNYLVQAKLFATGKRVDEEFVLSNLYPLPFWITWLPFSASSFPIGWPVLLAAGEFLGIGNLVNPLICGFLPCLGWLFFRQLRRQPPAREPHGEIERQNLLAAGFLALSPGVWLLGASWMAHTSCLAALFLLALGVLSSNWALAGGFGWAYLLLARPFDGVVLGGALFLLLFRGGKSISWDLKLLVAPFLAGLLLLFENSAITGDALQFPINMWFAKFAENKDVVAENCNRIGFGAEVGCMPTLGSFGHTFEKGLELAKDSFLRLDRLLFGIAGLSSLVIIGAWKQRGQWKLMLFMLNGPAVSLGSEKSPDLLRSLAKKKDKI